MDGAQFIQVYNPGQPLGPGNPSLTNIPVCPGGGGLTLMPNINGGTLSPTFYSVSGGTYWWWNGANWVNTGHGTGNGAAVNLGGCGSFIYNLVGFTGQVYVYNGTGTGTLLTTISNFNGGGPYDICCDCNCNFYVLNTTVPNQSLTMFSPAGVPTCSYSLMNFPNATAGGGFAIIGNMIYVKNNLVNGFFIGTMSGGTITFTQFPGFTASPGDFASCPSCVSLPVIASTSGTLGCGASTASVYATTTVAPVNYTWAGPGIVGPVNGSMAIVNQPGVYSCTVSAGGCPPTQSIVTTTVTSNGSIINAVISPTGNICLNGPAQLFASPNSPTNTYVWSGPGIISGGNTPTVSINAPGLYSVSISNTLGCTGSATVNVFQSPTLSIVYSSNTVCAQNLNNSSNSITLTPFGASNYTLLVSSNYTITNPNGPTMPITPVAPYQSMVTMGTNTLIGANGVCSATITSSFAIIPNPTVSVVPNPTICQGDSYTYTASGAGSYSWSPATGLNAIIGATVIANPSVTTVYSIVGSSVGCNAATVSSTLGIVQNPVITIVPGTPTVCSGSTVNLIAGGATAYTWTPATGLNITNGPQVGASPLADQTYSAIGAANGCTNVTAVTVSVIPLPTVNVSPAQSAICFGHNTSLQANGAAGYQWSPSFGLNNTTGPVVMASPNSNTTYTVTGNNGVCIGSGTAFVEVVPQPYVSVSSANYQICRGMSTQINGSGAQSYSWSPSTGLNTTTGWNVVASPSVTTNYTLFGYNSSGTVVCGQVVMYSVVVVPYAEAIVPETTTMCAGEGRRLNVSGGSRYEWFPPDGLSQSTGNSVVASPKISTVYTVVSSFDGNCPTTGTISVIIRPNPTVDAGPDMKFNIEDPDKFLKATGTGTLSWIEGDGTYCIPCPETFLITTKGGCYKIEAVNDYGCKAQDEVCIEIIKDFGVYIPDAFTPNGDGLNDVFYVYGYNVTDFTMEIFDRWGELIFTSGDQLKGWPGTYMGKEVEMGVYVYKVSYKGLDGKVYYRTGHVVVHR
jgi:gliding motility-associated-like protein